MTDILPWDEPVEDVSTPNGHNIPEKEEVLPEASKMTSMDIVDKENKVLQYPIEEIKHFPRPDWNNTKPVIENVLFLNQSLCKELIDKWGNKIEICARKINEIYIARNFKTEPTLSMMKGNFFETLGLGTGINGTRLDDLPRSKRKGKLFGSKTVDQLRIEQQALYFKSLCKLNGIFIEPGLNTQIRIYKEYKRNIYLVGDVDMGPLSFMYKGEPFNGHMDLKLTANVHSDFGPYGWGDINKIDMIQADVYHNLVMNIDFDLNDKFNPGNHLRKIYTPLLQKVFNAGEGRFMYWVFGYKYKDEPGEYKLQFKDPERLRTNERTAILGQRLDETINIIRNMRDSGWPTTPTYEHCKDCPVNKLNGGYCENADLQEKC